ncbi:MAG: T9SS type A sorting domain-containing protein [Saprospiraceae bacterium]|nr:T9SS type A sorting domain-containing protein [Saprospiraceae bacterium]
MNQFYKFCLATLFSILCIDSSILSQTLALWEFDSQTSATTTPTNGTVSDATWSAGTITYPAGNSSVATDKAISTTGFNTPSLNANKYLQFTISPNNNYAMSLGSISFYEQRSGTGPTSWVLRSSLDGYANDLNAPSPSTTSTTFGTTPQSVNLGIDFQYITTSVTFRIYAYGASSSAGTWRIDDLSVEGTMSDVTNPTILSSKSSISFTTILQGTPSVAKSFLASGFGLTSDLVLTTPTGYEISLSESTGYTNSLAFPQTGGRVSVKTVYVRLSGVTTGTFSGNLALTSTGITTKNIALSGSVITQPTRTNIATVRSRTTGTNVFTGGRVTVATEFGTNQIFIQDNSGGISVYSGSTNFGVDYGLQIGDSVEVFGYKSNFNSLDQITMLSFEKITTPQSIPTPRVITLADLATYEGELVTIQNIQFPGTGGTYSANTNYAFGYVPVRILSSAAPYSNNIVGSAVQSATGHVTGIAGVYGSNLQLYPRSTADFVTTGTGVTDANFQEETTLDVVAWNLEWFGHPSQGPTDDALQLANVKTVMTTINADLYQVEEVSDSIGFKSMVSTMAGYSCKCSPEYSYSNTSLADGYGQRLCFVYKDAVFSNVSAVPLLTAYKNDTTLLPDYPNTRTRFWASGRLPYLLTANVTINGTTRYLGFLGIHARANTSTNEAQEVYDMRKYDVEKLKTVLDATYPNLPFIMSGDFNDDLDETVSNVSTTISTYNTYINDASRYQLFTLPLSKAGAKSTTGFTDMIDHIIGSNEMNNALVSVRVGSPQTYITSYGTRTTDHYPVMAKFNLANITVVPVELLSFSAKWQNEKTVDVSWTTASELNAHYFDIERSIDGQFFQSIGQTVAQGFSKEKNNYHFLDNNPADSKIMYYRLKQVDYDGAYKYSPVVSVSRAKHPLSIHISPNPVKNILTIEDLTDMKVAKIYNLQGVLVSETTQYSMTTQNLTNGIYILEVENTEGVKVRTKFVKN